MAAAVPASSRQAIAGHRWLRLMVRAGLAFLALWALAFAADRRAAFMADYASNFRMNVWLWLAWLGPTLAAGLLFGLAVWVSFPRVRYEWSRLLLAGVALVPLVQVWWIWIAPDHVVGPWVTRADWLLDPSSQTAVAVLAGVAIASGFSAARGDRA